MPSSRLRRLRWSIAVLAVGVLACEAFTYDMLALGRHEAQALEGGDGGAGDDGGSGKDAGEVEELFACDGDYAGAGTPSLWADWPMPDSTPRCLNGLPCPRAGEADHGQDGNHRIDQPAWDLSTDGVARDLVTGLYWERGSSGAGIGWDLYCEQLELGGFVDWRPPTRIELLSIIDYGREQVLLDPEVFPFTPQPPGGSNSNFFAARATEAGRYYVDVTTGISYRTATMNHHVKCVRP